MLELETIYKCNLLTIFVYCNYTLKGEKMNEEKKTKDERELTPEERKIALKSLMAIVDAQAAKCEEIARKLRGAESCLVRMSECNQTGNTARLWAEHKMAMDLYKEARDLEKAPLLSKRRADLLKGYAAQVDYSKIKSAKDLNDISISIAEAQLLIEEYQERSF